MEAPTNSKKLQSFFGIVHYLNNFVPRLATPEKPLQKLTKNNTVWVWDRDQESSFENIKRLVSRQALANVH